MMRKACLRLVAPILTGALAIGVLTAAYAPGTPAPRSNLLINPTMEIDQVHEGGSVSLSSGTPAYVVDGVKIGFVSTGRNERPYDHMIECLIALGQGTHGSIGQVLQSQ